MNRLGQNDFLGFRVLLPILQLTQISGRKCPRFGVRARPTLTSPTAAASRFNCLLTIHTANSAYLTGVVPARELAERRDVDQRSSGLVGVAYQDAMAPGPAERAVGKRLQRQHAEIQAARPGRAQVRCRRQPEGFDGIAGHDADECEPYRAI